MEEIDDVFGVDADVVNLTENGVEPVPCRVTHPRGDGTPAVDVHDADDKRLAMEGPIEGPQIDHDRERDGRSQPTEHRRARPAPASLPVRWRMLSGWRPDGRRPLARAQHLGNRPDELAKLLVGLVPCPANQPGRLNAAEREWGFYIVDQDGNEDFPARGFFCFVPHPVRCHGRLRPKHDGTASRIECLLDDAIPALRG